MNKDIQKKVNERSGQKCEICSNANDLKIEWVEKMNDEDSNSYLELCSQCNDAVKNNLSVSGNQWRVLTESMWSEVPAVKVISWRLLNDSKEAWAQEALEMLYIEDDLLELAKAIQPEATHFDSNGAPLFKGDTVTLIKDLDVKGSSIVAKRGTAVRNINIPLDDLSHIVGKVDGQTIYIKNEFVKKS